MVGVALLDPLPQDPLAFPVGDRDGREVGFGFDRYALLEVPQCDLACSAS